VACPGSAGGTRDAHLAGAILLLALSDWGPGEGGTAVIPGSHKWVGGELEGRARAGLPPPSHQDLNLLFAQRLRSLAEAGRVLLPSCTCGAPLVGMEVGAAQRAGGSSATYAHTCSFAARVEAAVSEMSVGGSGSGGGGGGGGGGGAGPTAAGEGGSRLPESLLVQQVVCKRGDVLLLHPLALHSGTLNLGAGVRLMLNGMVRLKNGIRLAPAQ